MDGPLRPQRCKSSIQSLSVLSQVDVVLGLERAGAGVMEFVVMLLAQWNQILKRTTRTLGAQMVRVCGTPAAHATRCRLDRYHIRLAVVILLKPLRPACGIDFIDESTAVAEGAVALHKAI